MIRMTRWSVSVQPSLTPFYGTLLSVDNTPLADVLSKAKNLEALLYLSLQGWNVDCPIRPFVSSMAALARRLLRYKV